MNDTLKGLLIGLVGVAVGFMCVMYIAIPNYNEYVAIQQENLTLAQRLTELQQKQQDRDFYLSETTRLQDEFDKVLEAFPPDLNQEITIMFMDGIREDNEFHIESLELGEKEQFYTLGLNGTDTSLDAGTTDATATTDTTATTEATTTEATTTEAAATTDTSTDALTVDTVSTTDAYTCYRAMFPIAYFGSYESIKDVVTYIDSFSSRMTVSSINIAYDADNQEYTGDIEVFCYSIESTERDERSIQLDDVETGVENIFEGGNSTGGSSDSSLNKYNENDGAAIETSYDFYAMLNPATSDVSAKVVGQNGIGKDSTVISNSDNSSSTLSYEFYEKDGKNYCKYTLDDSSYEAEVTSAEDITLLIQSSARKDADDAVAVRVTINNTTSLPVYVKVSGDDATNPRVNIASKTGSVKVYK